MLANCYEQLANHNEALNSDESEASILYVKNFVAPISSDFFSTNKASIRGASRSRSILHQPINNATYQCDEQHCSECITVFSIVQLINVRVGEYCR
jgi:hypothetical protein